MAVPGRKIDARCLDSLRRSVNSREAQTLSQRYSQSTPTGLLLSVDPHVQGSPTCPLRWDIDRLISVS